MFNCPFFPFGASYVRAVNVAVSTAVCLPVTSSPAVSVYVRSYEVDANSTLEKRRRRRRRSERRDDREDGEERERERERREVRER